MPCEWKFAGRIDSASARLPHEGHASSKIDVCQRKTYFMMRVFTSGRKESTDALRPGVKRFYLLIETFSIFTSESGRSLESRGVDAILSTTSCPSVTRPKIV